jgi:hypothetical protein
MIINDRFTQFVLLFSRVARWYIFKPKIPILVHFGGPWNRKGCYIIWPFGISNGHLEYQTAIWNIKRPFGILYGHLVI